MFYKDLKRQWFKKRMQEYTVYLTECIIGKPNITWTKTILFSYDILLKDSEVRDFYEIIMGLTDEHHALAKILFKKDPCEAFFNARSISLKTKKIKKENEKDYIAVGYRTKKDIKKIQDSKDLEMERYIREIIK